MFYKMKINKDNFKFLGIVKREKIDDGDILYLTKDEFNMLDPKAVENYPKDDERKVPARRKKGN